MRRCVAMSRGGAGTGGRLIRSIRGIAVLTAMTAATGCGLVTEPAGGNVPSIVGTWTLTGTQAAPALQLNGTMAIASQRAGEVSGTAQWEARDGAGMVTLQGGLVTGRVLSDEDVDLDIQTGTGTRRFVARLVADTISGAWVQTSGGLNGTFRMVRGGAP